MNETTLYFITLDNEVKHINRDVKDLGYKDVAKDDYQVLLGTGENYNVDHDTWTKLYDFTVWGAQGPERKSDNGK